MLRLAPIAAAAVLTVASCAAALALWADILAPGSLFPVRPSGPAILQTLPD